jgi:hypothetical protein
MAGRESALTARRQAGWATGIEQSPAVVFDRGKIHGIGAFLRGCDPASTHGSQVLSRRQWFQSLPAADMQEAFAAGILAQPS